MRKKQLQRIERNKLVIEYLQERMEITETNNELVYFLDKLIKDNKKAEKTLVELLQDNFIYNPLKLKTKKEAIAQALILCSKAQKNFKLLKDDLLVAAFNLKIKYFNCLKDEKAIYRLNSAFELLNENNFKLLPQFVSIDEINSFLKMINEYSITKGTSRPSNIASEKLRAQLKADLKLTETDIKYILEECLKNKNSNIDFFQPLIKRCTQVEEANQPYKVSIKVINSLTGISIAKVRVAIIETNEVGFTDNYGLVYFEASTRNEITLLISHESYQQKSITFSMENNKHKRLKIELIQFPAL